MRPTDDHPARVLIAVGVATVVLTALTAGAAAASAEIGVSDATDQIGSVSVTDLSPGSAAQSCCELPPPEPPTAPCDATCVELPPPPPPEEQ